MFAFVGVRLNSPTSHVARSAHGWRPRRPTYAIPPQPRRDERWSGRCHPRGGRRKTSEVILQSLVLICDPTHDYSRAFHENLSSHGLDVRHVHSADECLAEISVYSPRTVVISAEQQPGDLDRLLKGLEESSEGVPELVLIGESLPGELAERWGFPVECCLQTPVDEQQLATQLMQGGTESPPEVLERVEGVNSGTRQSPGLSSWDSEGGFVPTGSAPRA